jgi:hypothetical protein
MLKMARNQFCAEATYLLAEKFFQGRAWDGSLALRYGNPTQNWTFAILPISAQGAKIA